MCVFNLRWIWVMEAGMLILASLDMGILIIQKEIFVIKQIHINEEQQLLVKFSLHECEHLTDQYQYVSWANMKSFTRLSVKHVFALFSQETPQFAFELIQLIFVNAGLRCMSKEPWNDLFRSSFVSH